MSAGDNVRSFDAAVPQPARDRFAIDLWCHACRQRKRALLDRPPTEADETLSCPTCMSEFVERLDEPPRQRHAAAGPTQPRRNTHIRFMRRLPPGVVPGVVRGVPRAGAQQQPQHPQARPAQTTAPPGAAANPAAAPQPRRHTHIRFTHRLPPGAVRVIPRTGAQQPPQQPQHPQARPTQTIPPPGAEANPAAAPPNAAAAPPPQVATNRTLHFRVQTSHNGAVSVGINRNMPDQLPDAVQGILQSLSTAAAGGQSGQAGNFVFHDEALERVLNQLAANYVAPTTPACEDAVAALPRVKSSPDAMGACGCTSEGCSICQEDWQDADDAVAIKLPCNHAFHEACLLPWLQKQNTCPVCRYKLPEAAARPSSAPTTAAATNANATAAGAGPAATPPTPEPSSSPLRSPTPRQPEDTAAPGGAPGLAGESSGEGTQGASGAGGVAAWEGGRVDALGGLTNGFAIGYIMEKLAPVGKMLSCALRPIGRMIARVVRRR